jgi:hypothetical protein
MFEHPQPYAAVPAGPVEHQHNLLGGTRADLPREGFQFDFEEGMLTVVARWKMIRPEAACTKSTR